MIVEAQDAVSGETHYFELNFAPKNGADYVFMWIDGTRRIMRVSTNAQVPDGVTPLHATFDVPSHEIIVQTGR